MHYSPFSLRMTAMLVALTMAGSCSLTASDQPPLLKTIDLQVSIDVPPTWRPFLDEDITDALCLRLIATFRKRGYAGRIEHRLFDRAPAKDVPQLEIRLVEWRIGRSGTADCTLSASVRTSAGERALGVITSSASFLPHASGHWGLNRPYETAGALEDSAEHALRELYTRLLKADVIPGLGAKK